MTAKLLFSELLINPLGSEFWGMGEEDEEAKKWIENRGETKEGP